MLFGKGLAASTLRSYSAVHKRYLRFCAQFNISLEFPLTENVLCYFASALSDDFLKHQTIKYYFSRIRHAQIAMGYGDPFAGQPMPRLEYVLKGIKCNQAEKNPQSKPRLPTITINLLQRMFKIWEDAQDPDARMLAAACCLGFFQFLRAAEFTTPSLAEYDPGCHLSLTDIAIDSHVASTTIRVAIKQSKDGPLPQGNPHFYQPFVC